MWIDQRGSEILPRAECLRLLAVEGRGNGIGRLAVSRPGAPIVVPVNIAYDGGEVLVRLGDGFMAEHLPGRLVAVEADGVNAPAGTAWSVLVRGLARVLGGGDLPEVASPRPMAPVPGHLVVAVRPDVVTGRRFPLASRRARAG